MDLREVAAAYQSLYNVNEEVLEENQIIFEDLSQEEVDNFVEEIVDEFLEEGFSLEEIQQGFGDYIDEECSLLTEARAAKRQPGASKGPKQSRKSLMQSQREKLAAQKAKSEARKGGALTVRPSSALATKPKGGALTKTSSSTRAASVERKKAVAAKGTKGSGVTTASGSTTKGALPSKTGGSTGVGRKETAKSGGVKSKDGSMGAEGKKGTALPPAKKSGAMIKRDTKSVSGMETGPKAEVKAGVRKAMTYRGVGGGKKTEVAGAKRRKMSDVVASAERKAASPKEKVKRAAKETVQKAKSAVKSAGQGAKDAVKSGVKKARNVVGSALGKLADKVKSESLELDSFDTVVAYLIDEGIASDFDEATAKMAKLSEGTIAKIHSSQLELIEGYKPLPKEKMARQADKAYGKEQRAVRSGDEKETNKQMQRRIAMKDPSSRKTQLKNKMESVQTAYEAVYGGEKKEEEPKKMTVTNADKKANTKAYQNYKAGDKRYKAADHMKGDK